MKTVEKTTVEVSVGVQLQVACPFVVTLEAQPEMLLTPFIKLKVPAMLELAVNETGEPYVAVVPPPGIEREIFGVAFVTDKVIVTGVNPVDPALSVTVMVCV